MLGSIEVVEYDCAVRLSSDGVADSEPVADSEFPIPIFIPFYLSLFVNTIKFLPT